MCNRLINLALRMDNAKVKPESIKFLSLIVRGLSNFHKRRAIFSWCRKQKTNLIFLQETHSTTERQDQWRKEWGAPVLFSHGSTNTRGVAILMKNSLNITIQQSEISSDGRFIVLKADINNETYTIANVYGPNKDADAVKFYRNLSKLLRNDDFGIKLDAKEFKMVQYADDLTAFVSDIRSAQHLFKLLDQFEKCSGLKVNYTKTEAMWTGSSRNNTETPLALKWRKTVKALGVHFSYNNEESLQKNFYDKLRGIKSQIRLWSWRGLSLFGKVTIIKSFLLPKVLYISSIFPSPLEIIKAFQTIIYDFLWKGPDEIARTAVINDFEFGGLKVTDLTTSVMSLRISWIGRFLRDTFYPWKAYLLYLLRPFGGKLFLHCDFNIDDYNIFPIFYKEMLHWWSDFISRFDLVSPRETIIWNNHNIRVNGKPIFYNNYNSANIVLLSDLKFD